MSQDSIDLAKTGALLLALAWLVYLANLDDSVTRIQLHGRREVRWLLQELVVLLTLTILLAGSGWDAVMAPTR